MKTTPNNSPQKKPRQLLARLFAAKAIARGVAARPGLHQAPRAGWGRRAGCQAGPALNPAQLKKQKAPSVALAGLFVGVVSLSSLTCEKVVDCEIHRLAERRPQPFRRGQALLPPVVNAREAGAEWESSPPPGNPSCPFGLPVRNNPLFTPTHVRVRRKNQHAAPCFGNQSGPPNHHCSGVVRTRHCPRAYYSCFWHRAFANGRHGAFRTRQWAR